MPLSSRNSSSWQTSAKRSPITSRIGLQVGSFWPMPCSTARLVTYAKQMARELPFEMRGAFRRRNAERVP
jgi:hypothetical protein